MSRGSLDADVALLLCKLPNLVSLRIHTCGSLPHFTSWILEQNVSSDGRRLCSPSIADVAVLPASVMCHDAKVVDLESSKVLCTLPTITSLYFQSAYADRMGALARSISRVQSLDLDQCIISVDALRDLLRSIQSLKTLRFRLKGTKDDSHMRFRWVDLEDALLLECKSLETLEISGRLFSDLQRLRLITMSDSLEIRPLYRLWHFEKLSRLSLPLTALQTPCDSELLPDGSLGHVLLPCTLYSLTISSPNVNILPLLGSIAQARSEHPEGLPSLRHLRISDKAGDLLHDYQTMFVDKFSGSHAPAAFSHGVWRAVEYLEAKGFILEYEIEGVSDSFQRGLYRNFCESCWDTV